MKDLLKEFYEYQDQLLWGKDIDSIDDRIEMFMKKIEDDKTYLVAYTIQDGAKYTDHFEAFREEGVEAKERYEEVLKIDDLYSASLTIVLDSTDY